MFHGFDFDSAMLRIGSMNMLLPGVENPDIRYRGSLAQDHASEKDKLGPAPKTELSKLEAEIHKGMKELKGMLKSEK